MTAPITGATELGRVGTNVGTYELIELVGVGGMGAVYRAVDRRSGITVAVKVFGPTAIEASALARFYQEARVQQMLDHPHIARFHELVTCDGRPCLVMEYLDGESVAAALAARGPLAPEEALRILADLAGAVAHAHAHSVVHRDIKPGNIRRSSSGAVKLLDFGIAKTPHVQGLTTPGHVIGTPRYLAPEQLLGEAATPASDVWGLGILLYEMTTGRAPFDGATLTELWHSVNSGVYLAPSQTPSTGRRAAVDPTIAVRWRAIDDLVAACLIRDPKRRRLSAAEIAIRARAALNDNAPTRRAFGREQLAVFGWSRRWTLGAAAAVLLLVLAAFLAWPNSAADGPRSVHHIDVVSGHATVYVNGRRAGRTPLTYTGRFGEVITVDLELDGYQTRHEQIQLGVEGTSTYAMQARASKGAGR